MPDDPDHDPVCNRGEACRDAYRDDGRQAEADDDGTQMQRPRAVPSQMLTKCGWPSGGLCVFALLCPCIFSFVTVLVNGKIAVISLVMYEAASRKLHRSPFSCCAFLATQAAVIANEGSLQGSATI